MKTTRTCAGCSLCCKLLSVAAFEKPINTWCKRARPGSRLFDLPTDRRPAKALSVAGSQRLTFSPATFGTPRVAGCSSP